MLNWLRLATITLALSSCAYETDCEDGIDNDEDGATDYSDRDCCCKFCDEGKACGDTCIDADDSCNVEPGCACD